MAVYASGSILLFVNIISVICIAYAVLELDADTISKATNGYSPDNLIGEGGYGA